MSAATVFGLCGAVAVGLGLYGLIANPQPLRKILAFNLLGSGVFLFFGVVARRGAAAGFGGDPVPQALVITGMVVAFSATALAVALLLRLFQATGSATLRADAAGERGHRSERRHDSASSPDSEAVTTMGGFLLVLAIVVPVAGVLLAFVGRRAPCRAGRVRDPAARPRDCGRDRRRKAAAGRSAASICSAGGHRRSACRCARTGCQRS